MGSLEALEVYWSSPGALTALMAHTVLLIVLGVTYQVTSGPRPRLHILYSVYAVDVSLWSFLASSTLLCVALSDRLEYEITGVKLATSVSVFGGLIIGALAGMVLTFSEAAQEAHMARLGVDRIRVTQRDEAPTLVFSERPGLFAASSSLHGSVVILSQRLQQVLSPNELEAVIAHEVAHLTNKDSRRRLASTLLSKCMFFDPLSKFVDPAIHRQGEFLADDMAASDPTKARALASALETLGAVCYADHGGGKAPGLRSRQVPLELRLRRLAGRYSG